MNTSNAQKQSSLSSSLQLSANIQITFLLTVSTPNSSPFPANYPPDACRPGARQSPRLDPNLLRERRRRLRFCISPAAKTWLQGLASDQRAGIQLRLSSRVTDVVVLEVELPQTSIDLKAFSQGLAVCGRNHDQSQVLICSFILQRINLK